MCVVFVCVCVCVCSLSACSVFVCECVLCVHVLCVCVCLFSSVCLSMYVNSRCEGYTVEADLTLISVTTSNFSIMHEPFFFHITKLVVLKSE